LIPAANITAWRRQAPWPDDTQVEQDLILSRLMVEIANHALLGPELSFRGGTAIHKLQMKKPARYSEDLDYVRNTESGIGPYLDALAEIAAEVGLERAGTDTGRGAIVNAKFDGKPTSGMGSIRIKIEINIGETTPLRSTTETPYSVDSPWWQGEAKIRTFALEELLGTKLRALYQRKKGRDLFDLWCMLRQRNLDDALIVEAFRHYIGNDEFTFPQFARNLESKLEDRDFTDDLLQLVTVPPADYDPAAAADLVMTRLGSRLHNAPPVAEIERSWRL
jgi:predicted nucleotidyltransferase component of viral defense system